MCMSALYAQPCMCGKEPRKGEISPSFRKCDGFGVVCMGYQWKETLMKQKSSPRSAGTYSQREEKVSRLIYALTQFLS